MDLQTAHQNLPESSADVQMQAEMGKNSDLITQFSHFSTFLKSQTFNQKSKNWHPRQFNYTSESISNSSGSKEIKAKSAESHKNGIQ
jgi:hypothetical protein